jgi:hypothetical protein
LAPPIRHRGCVLAIEAEPSILLRAVALSLIEHEWEFAQPQADGRMIIKIGNTIIRTIR